MKRTPTGRDSSGETENGRLNFRQFVKVLAFFQPIDRSKKNSLNSRQDKLRCEYSLLFCFQ